MSTKERQRWLAGNQAHLSAEIERVRQALLRHGTLSASAAPAEAVSAPTLEIEPGEPTSARPPLPELLTPSALDILCERCGLTPFERDVLLLCAGLELDSRFHRACTQAGAGAVYPTFGLALAALPGAHLSAVLPGSPLRRDRLIRVGAGQTLTASALRLEERVLYFLLGMDSLDDRLQSLLRVVARPPTLSDSQRALVERAQGLLSVELHHKHQEAAIWLCGPDAAARRAIAAQVCAESQLTLYALRAADVPQRASEREELHGLWVREQRMAKVALLLSYQDNESPETLQAAAAWLDGASGLVLAHGRELYRAGDRPIIRLDVPRPSREEQGRLWRAALAPLPEIPEELIDRLTSQFRLGTAGIQTASAHAIGRLAEGTAVDPPQLEQALWQACLQSVRPRLDELAHRVETTATWEDLVLPEAEQRSLRELVAHQRHQATVYHRWGFGRSGARGLGVTALFVGQSGTGKTLAAEVVAQALGLDLYRIDLSQVISKYIGETEKNLRRVFDAAEEGGTVLLFDEADALFGKRTEVKDSHDRYANIEISYLLQRMEAYQGVSILTSNMRSALDSAFLRRLRFIVHFPFPDSEQRVELWRRALPSQAPQSGIQLAKLARLTMAGGHIRNIALSAAFLAAEERSPLAMRHLLSATRSEYKKLERPITEAEIGGWV